MSRLNKAERCAAAANGMASCTLSHQYDGIACLTCRPALKIELDALACEFEDDGGCEMIDLQLCRACENCVVRYAKVGAL